MNETPFQLTGKTVLVTGASSGIGAETARLISRMGGKLVLTARNEEKLNQVCSELSGDGHQVIPADITKEEDLKALVGATPILNGLVHSAGINEAFPVKFINERHLSKTMDINYKGPVLLTGQLFKKKKIANQSSILFISSISSQFPYKGGTAYVGSKAALEAYAKVVALEYSDKGIRVNCLCPGMVKTPLYAEAEAKVTKEMMDKHIQQYPLGVGYPEDVANAVVFFLSDASRWITATTLKMDGGLTAGAK